ncbi:phosphoenolpyruvate carboxykinase (ATP) [Halorarum salinum]|uniref:phosphoenolpyruvate carboxykinase (ATP) n=1 Tax=Halorarum salinum TaxID=2743089 RepID=A0A7D5QBH3_9EURY|nr:phosphoenolpyruvate carboxykinase (ATP) [Halobaculum salinum]QLG62578.1 phosphoenolpyruvate carboxykinase (ATP) [Halobaculum salinum]
MSNAWARDSAPAAALPDPVEAEDVTYDPSFELLRELAADEEVTTEFGSPAYVSEHRSRNADRTRNAVDDEFDRDEYALLEEAADAVGERGMLCLDRRLGRHPDLSFVCRLFVPREYARIALAWAKLCEPVSPGDATGGPPEPDFVTVQLPDRDDVAIRVLPDEGFTAVLGSDYTGEAKKSFLRLYMYRAKRRGGLGLHAGGKRVVARSPDGDLDAVGQLFLGLSATGKSTLTAHGFGLEAPEEATMLQDDVCALLPDGTVAGSEGNGLYVKTIGLDPGEQSALYEATTHESAVLENVAVDGDGVVDFDSDEYTSNGRATVLREHLSSAAADVDLERVDQVFFITRNPTMPPVARLDHDEAAAAFMLGESVETSAGDPDRAGESIRVVGTNPFIIGPEGEEGNRFRDLVERLDVDCFVLNTGSLGDGSVDVGVEDTVTILRELARGTVEWREDPETGFTVPSRVPGLDVGAFSVADAVDDHERRLRDLRADRRSYLDGFEALEDRIRNAVY